MGLELIERILQLPALVVERAALGARRDVLLVEDRAQQTVALLWFGQAGII